MKKQFNKTLPVFITMIIFTIAVRFFNGSCSKDTKSPDPGKTTPGSSKIVYTNVKPDSATISTSGLLYNPDLNSDGNTYFVLHVSSRLLTYAGANNYQVYLTIMPSNENNAIIGDGSGYACAVDSASAIVPDNFFNQKIKGG